MTEEANDEPYDLEQRTELFAKRVLAFVKRLTRTNGNIIDGRQIIRSSGWKRCDVRWCKRRRS